MEAAKLQDKNSNLSKLKVLKNNLQTQNIKAICFSEMSLNFCQTRRRHAAEDCNY